MGHPHRSGRRGESADALAHAAVLDVKMQDAGEKHTLYLWTAQLEIELP